MENTFTLHILKDNSYHQLNREEAYSILENAFPEAMKNTESKIKLLGLLADKNNSIPTTNGYLKLN